jgi:hypothetical protein
MNAAYAEEVQEIGWTRQAASAPNARTERISTQWGLLSLAGNQDLNPVLDLINAPSLSESLRGHRAVSLQRTREQSSVTDEVLRAEINRAALMLDRSGDWEDEEPVLFSQETLRRAEFFLSTQSKQFYKLFGHFPPAPHVGPGPDGSVDIFWKKERWELLVNIPADTLKMASFYGDDYGAQKIKGSFDPTSLHYGIVPWLIRS